MSDVIFKSILIKKKNLFFLGFCVAGVFAFMSFSLLSLTPVSFPNVHNALIKANLDLQGVCPSEGWNSLWKMPNCEWCSLEVSHSTFIHNTQSQHLRPKKNTSIVVTLTHFLFCTVISVWSFQLSKQYRVNQISARCHQNGKESLHRDWTQTWGGGQVCTLAESLSFVWKFLHVDAGLGDERRWHTGSSAHTNTTVNGSPPAAVCSWWGLWGALHGRQTPSRQGPHRALANRGLWLVTHPGEPKAFMVISKYFWSLYKLSLLWQHFSKLESQTKGTFMLECRRFTNS